MRPFLILLSLIVSDIARAGGDAGGDGGAAADGEAARALFDEQATRASLERFARTHYAPALAEHGDRIVTAPTVSIDRVPPGWAWVLAEPAARLQLCGVLADDLDTTDDIDAVYADCQRGALAAASARIDTARAAEVVAWIAHDIARDDEHPHRQAALAALGRVAKLADTMKRRARAADRAAIKRIGKRVLFGQVAPDTWQPFRATTDASPPCDAFAFLAVPPPVRARDGFDLSVTVGGESCHSEVVFGAAEREIVALCGDDQVLQPGENDVRVTISRNINRVAGKRWDPKRFRKIRYHANTPGKRLATAAWRCTMPGGR